MAFPPKNAVFRNVGGTSPSVSFFRKRFSAFTLVELIVVITILAILATIGFLALSGYTQDARDSVIKANVRSIQTAIASESALTGNSPRYYVVHDSDYALSGAFAYVDGNGVPLTGGTWDALGTNYTAGRPDFVKLKLNPEKFKIAMTGPNAPLASVFDTRTAEASYDANSAMVGAADFLENAASGRKRSTSYFQTAAISPATKIASVNGNFPTTAAAGYVTGLLRAQPGSVTNLTGSLMDGASASAVLPDAPSDPNFSSVSLLVHADGASLTDVTGKTITSVAQTALTGAVSKFWGSSVVFPNAGSYFSVPNSASWNFTSASGTIEMWVNLPSGYAFQSLVGQSSAGNDHKWFTYVYADGKIGIGINGTNEIVSAAGVFVANQWNHVAFVHNGVNTYIYYNGTLVASDNAKVVFTNTTDPLYVGNLAISGANKTYFDEIRVTTGIARYSGSSFAVPTDVFPSK